MRNLATNVPCYSLLCVRFHKVVLKYHLLVNSILAIGGLFTGCPHRQSLCRCGAAMVATRLTRKIQRCKSVLLPRDALWEYRHVWRSLRAAPTEDEIANANEDADPCCLPPQRTSHSSFRDAPTSTLTPIPTDNEPVCRTALFLGCGLCLARRPRAVSCTPRALANAG
ncbi:hypothetical protein DFH08DRAFT_146703 [Mycena albidolilacea]|uniref:Uncharacterized protein n=1 Tax=Mycena albidolilacea TaxID=1033008 RepID=A0AAD6YWD8_9AGAR|nr:hypothetical protein DFH08DRAFT_146703 [Mycena albidolilacea]